MSDVTWTLSHHHARIGVREYVAGFVDVQRCNQWCRGCPSFGTTWACPPHEVDPMPVWLGYQWLHIEAVRVHFSEVDRAREWSADAMRGALTAARDQEKRRATLELEARVRDLDATRLLYGGGPCQVCATCTRPTGGPCPLPDQIQYSIESLGGDVLRTACELLGITLDWSDGTHLPPSTSVVLGVLSDHAQLPVR